jgi:hypothetical protein
MHFKKNATEGASLQASHQRLPLKRHSMFIRRNSLPLELEINLLSQTGLLRPSPRVEPADRGRRFESIRLAWSHLATVSHLPV